jgi:hypothetical protein
LRNSCPPCKKPPPHGSNESRRARCPYESASPTSRSAFAATIATGGSGFRENLADVALAVYVVATVLAVVLVAVLLWRLIRPEGRRRRRRVDS